MIFFINLLRALAVCLITNAHYEGVYPSDIIANGGLIGDILFFFCSGYCLYNVRLNFAKWYSKRLYRIYVPVIAITLIYLAIGLYSFETRNIFEWLIYPTNYHFIASMVILLIPYYFCVKNHYLKNHLHYVMIAVFALYLILYFTVYDRSYYHIDDVHEHMTKFLFFESMLLGGLFRKNDEKLRNHFKFIYPLFAVILFAVYFAAKLFFSRYNSHMNLQFINQIIIFMLLACIALTFSSLDGKLEKLPSFIKKVIVFISEITLEIYVVQYALIDLLKSFKLPFPLNWLCLTGGIILAAFILHILSKGIYAFISICCKKIKKAADK